MPIGGGRCIRSSPSEAAPLPRLKMGLSKRRQVIRKSRQRHGMAPHRSDPRPKGRLLRLGRSIQLQVAIRDFHPRQSIRRHVMWTQSMAVSMEVRVL